MPTAREKLIKDTQNDLSVESLASILTPHGGQLPKNRATEAVEQILNGAAPYAAATIRDHIRQRRGRKNLKSSLQRACEFTIEQVRGKARQQIEHSGGIMTYGELARSAERLAGAPPVLLIETEEKDGVYQPVTPVAAPTPALAPAPTVAPVAVAPAPPEAEAETEEQKRKQLHDEYEKCFPRAN